MNSYHKNPRQITKSQHTQLRDSLDDLGDLSGVVHDLNSDEIIGGNQRSSIFNINHCEIELVSQNEEPDEQGTVAQGFIIWRDHKYAYRQVRWSPEQCEEANIKANKAGGFWDFDILANEFEMGDLLDWGFSKNEFGIEPEESNNPEQAIPDFKEYGEDAADDVVYLVCPKCEHRFPK